MVESSVMTTRRTVIETARDDCAVDQHTLTPSSDQRFCDDRCGAVTGSVEW
jgi:hypothetical protein